MSAGNVVAEVSIVPIGTGSPGLSEYVADCVNILEKRSRIKYQLTSMGTILEGPMKDVLDAIQLMHEAPFNDGVLRVVTTIKIDDRRDKKISIEGKVTSVKKHLENKE